MVYSHYLNCSKFMLSQSCYNYENVAKHKYKTTSMNVLKSCLVLSLRVYRRLKPHLTIIELFYKLNSGQRML